MSYNVNDKIWTGYIYEIYNDVNNKKYIGQTITTIKDRWHGHMSACLQPKNKNYLYKAMRKHGRDKFHIKEIEIVHANTEKELVNKLNILEQEYIRKYHTMYNDTIIGGYNTEPGGDNKHVEGRYVCKYDFALNLLDTYDSTELAGRLNNIDGATIYGACLHSFYTAGGYIWAFKGDEPLLPPYVINTNLVNNSHFKECSIEKQRRLLQFNWNGKRIYEYNLFGELQHIYEDIVDAIDNLGINNNTINKILEGKVSNFKRKILRFENDPFDKYKLPNFLQPIILYDLFGNYIDRFETIGDAEKYCNVSSGTITKTIKRGGSCAGYLPCYYGDKLTRSLYRCERQIVMKDKNNNIKHVFPSMKAVAKFLGYADCHEGLTKAINTQSLYHDCYWDFLKEFEVNNERRFFEDE